MTILVTGSTGTIGSLVVSKLAEAGAAVRALVRTAGKAAFPAGVTPVQGDLTDLDSMRAVLGGVDTLFLLNAVAADELTQALVALDLAREAGIERIVYFSVFNGKLFTDVPHFTGKHTAEQVIEEQAMPATVLRPAYFFQNDARLKDAIMGGVYPMPVGRVGLAMVDARDIAEAAAAELLRRDRAPTALPRSTIELVGPDTLTGEQVAAIWSEALGAKVSYPGDDLDAFEQQMRETAPSWQARDLRMMFRAFHQFGMVPPQQARTTLEALLGHPLRTYRDFARETVEAWRKG